MKGEKLDIILVPSGILIMCIYHLFILYKYKYHPECTSIGYENCNKEAWVGNMLKVEVKDKRVCVAVLNGLLSASTSLTSISLLLCSLIGALLGNSSTNFLTSSFIFGDTKTTRHFVHACFLITMRTGDVRVESIQKAVIRGSILGSWIARTLPCNQFAAMDFYSDYHVCWFRSYTPQQWLWVKIYNKMADLQNTEFNRLKSTENLRILVQMICPLIC